MEINPPWFEFFVEKMKKRYTILKNDLELLLNDDIEKALFLNYAEESLQMFQIESSHDISDTNGEKFRIMAGIYYRFYLKKKYGDDSIQMAYEEHQIYKAKAEEKQKKLRTEQSNKDLQLISVKNPLVTPEKKVNILLHV